MIDAYAYGSMTIDGKVYKKDLIIFPGRIESDWWRKKGHILSMDDLAEVIEARPELLIVGTGDSGVMRVPLAVEQGLKNENIELIAEDTHKAARLFNEQARMGRSVAGAFHLTC